MPVIAPVKKGTTRFIEDDIEEAVQAVGHISKVSQCNCRQRFEERFSASRMAQGYLARTVPLLPSATLTLGMSVDLAAGLDATYSVSDDFCPPNSRPPGEHRVELSEEDAELRHEQRQQVWFVWVIVVGHIQ